jgi:hypothetical protein
MEILNEFSRIMEIPIIPIPLKIMAINCSCIEREEGEKVDGDNCRKFHSYPFLCIWLSSI